MYADLDRKKCPRCKEVKSVEEFHKGYRRKKDGGISYRALCKPCETKRHAEYVDANRDRINEKRAENYRKDKSKAIALNLKRYYGMSRDSYDALFEKQSGNCAICGLHQSNFARRFDVDHCHETKVIRGLLCIRCNRGIGLLQDSEKILRTAIKYLRRSRTRG